jgi:hypothetical protein
VNARQVTIVDAARLDHLVHHAEQARAERG